MKVTHEVDPISGNVCITAVWNIREQHDADRAPARIEDSISAEILLDAERIVRRIESHQRLRAAPR